MSHLQEIIFNWWKRFRCQKNDQQLQVIWKISKSKRSFHIIELFQIPRTINLRADSLVRNARIYPSFTVHMYLELHVWFAEFRWVFILMTKKWLFWIKEVMEKFSSKNVMEKYYCYKQKRKEKRIMWTRIAKRYLSLSLVLIVSVFHQLNS